MILREKRGINEEVGKGKLRDSEMGREERKCEGGEKSVVQSGKGNFAELRHYCVSEREREEEGEGCLYWAGMAGGRKRENTCFTGQWMLDRVGGVVNPSDRMGVWHTRTYLLARIF